MTTSSVRSGSTAVTTARPASQGRSSRLLQAFAPCMASVAMRLPVSRTLWIGLIAERYGDRPPGPGTG